MLEQSSTTLDQIGSGEVTVEMVGVNADRVVVVQAENGVLAPVEGVEREVLERGRDGVLVVLVKIASTCGPGSMPSWYAPIPQTPLSDCDGTETAAAGVYAHDIRPAIDLVVRDLLACVQNRPYT